MKLVVNRMGAPEKRKNVSLSTVLTRGVVRGAVSPRFRGVTQTEKA
jgi:hypothetical protein